MNVTNLKKLKPELASFMTNIRKCNDTKASHLIFVDHSGDIYIDSIPIGNRWSTIVPLGKVKFHLPIRHAGNGWVGANADRFEMIESFMILVRAWQQQESGMVCAEETLTRKDYRMIEEALPSHQ